MGDFTQPQQKYAGTGENCIIAKLNSNFNFNFSLSFELSLALLS